MDPITSSVTRGSLELAGDRVFPSRGAHVLSWALIGGSELEGAAGQYRIAMAASTDNVIAFHGGLGGGVVLATSL